MFNSTDETTERRPHKSIKRGVSHPFAHNTFIDGDNLKVLLPPIRIQSPRIPERLIITGTGRAISYNESVEFESPIHFPVDPEKKAQTPDRKLMVWDNEPMCIGEINKINGKENQSKIILDLRLNEAKSEFQKSLKIWELRIAEQNRIAKQKINDLLSKHSSSHKICSEAPAHLEVIESGSPVVKAKLTGVQKLRTISSEDKIIVEKHKEDILKLNLELEAELSHINEMMQRDLGNIRNRIAALEEEYSGGNTRVENKRRLTMPPRIFSSPIQSAGRVIRLALKRDVCIN